MEYSVPLISISTNIRVIKAFAFLQFYFYCNNFISLSKKMKLAISKVSVIGKQKLKEECRAEIKGKGCNNTG